MLFIKFAYKFIFKYSFDIIKWHNVENLLYLVNRTSIDLVVRINVVIIKIHPNVSQDVNLLDVNQDVSHPEVKNLLYLVNRTSIDLVVRINVAIIKIHPNVSLVDVNLLDVRLLDVNL